MAEVGHPLAPVHDDTTARYLAIETEIDECIAESRRRGKHSVAALVAFILVAVAVILLVARGLWPPKSVQVPPTSTVSAPG